MDISQCSAQKTVVLMNPMNYYQVRAERMKAVAQEKLTNKMAATRRIAEEKRANAQVKLNDNALKTTEKVEYIRRTGYVPSSFSFTFKLPSICWQQVLELHICNFFFVFKQMFKVGITTKNSHIREQQGSNPEDDVKPNYISFYWLSQDLRTDMCNLYVV